jgi:hypothetical protein
MVSLKNFGWQERPYFKVQTTEAAAAPKVDINIK